MATITRSLGNLRGPAGPGVPKGGSAGQILTKTSGTDYQTAWKDPAAGGTPGGEVALADLSQSGAEVGQVLKWGGAGWVPGPDLQSAAGQPADVRVIDPRTFLAAGQTWTGVTSNRAAFQSALDAAHQLTMDNAAMHVVIIVPPGVATLPDVAPSTRLPVNRRSSASPQSKITSKNGFGLRVNMAGRITFQGEGATSIFRLSDAGARSLFYIDTDTGVSWTSTGKYFYLTETTRYLAQRPIEPMVFQNYAFRDFAIDNNLAKGVTGVLIGNRHGKGVEQPYISIDELDVQNVTTYGYVVPAGLDDLDDNNKAFINFLFRQTTLHEAKAGIVGGYSDRTTVVPVSASNTLADNSADYWKGWDLSTEAGRLAAYTCGGSGDTAGGFNFVRNVRVKNCDVPGPTRGVLLVVNRRSAFSYYMDAVELDELRCDTLAGHRTNTPYFTQTHLYPGGDCIGGTVRITRSKSIAIGDDSYEIGGFTHTYLDDIYSENPVLDSVLQVFSQKPLNPYGTTLTVNRLHQKVTGDALVGSLSNREYIRAVPVETILENENDTGTGADQETSAVPYPLAVLNVDDALIEVDGAFWDANGAKKRGNLPIFNRLGRIGFVFSYPARKVNIRRMRVVFRGMNIYNSNGSNDPLTLVMAQLAPRLSHLTSGTTQLHIDDLQLVFEDCVATVPLTLVGVMAAASGSAVVENVDLQIVNSSGVDNFSVVAIGKYLSAASNAEPDGVYDVSGVTASVIGSAISGEKVGVEVANDIPISAGVISNVRMGHISGSTSVLKRSGANGPLVTTARTL
ncbi:hypothetical protein [Rathayibacter sp. AY2B5]|uniref:hypothetical protein n=1 Tax=Rathayibacter sp. AY2B5 TaxID=2080570 RepID=UPI000CE8290E|nr:hypothetical protein [Rathayibacter sp. AY2B5]PPG40175.1 hypothetical protein C5C30_09815 [Rathayibacter sp. AY2B5]